MSIPRDIAGLMLSAILSDTVLLKSPTTTDMDRDISKKLARIARINIEEFGTLMFKEGSSIGDMSIDEIINSDMKTYGYEGGVMAIGQIMTIAFDELLAKEKDIIKALNDMCKHDIKYAFFFVTDIINEGAYLYYSDSAKRKAAIAYGLQDIYEGVYLHGFVSRKKQMLPPLLDVEDRR